MKEAAHRPRETWPLFAVCAVFIALVWIVFGQTLRFGFVNYDDRTYVYGNSLVSAGLSWDGLARAFVDTQTRNWHPLTIISHMVDCQFYGLAAGGHHFTNVLLHLVAALLLFAWLFNLTDQLWNAAFVTAVFAIHPMRVESVAWIAERKDVLSAAFFFLTLLAYTRYVRQRSVGRYLMMLILLACGLMSKPMVVTLPVVLLLLDYWPLGRWQGTGSTSQRRNVSTSLGGLVIEKLPLLGLSLTSCIVTFLLQERTSGSIAQLPLMWRLENALVSCVSYIAQIFWPANLTVFYPHPEDTLALWQVAGAAVFLIAVTWVAFALRRTKPYFIVGWLWYLVMLLPVIGIVEVGLQGHADRYTYLPHVGLLIALTWLIADLVAFIRVPKPVTVAVGVITIALLAACARKQTTYWRDSETLWTRALAVTKDNDVAQANYGMFLLDRGQLDDALSHLQTALSIRSGSGHAHYNLSLALIHDDIGNVLARKGRLDEAVAELSEASRLEPNYPDAHYNLGTVLFQNGDTDGAIAEWRITLSIQPHDADVQTSLGNALIQKGELREAIEHYEAALRTAPDSVLPLNNLAWILSTSPDAALRNGSKAVALAKDANRLSQNNNPIFVRTLAAAFAETGQFETAINTAESAARLANGHGQVALAQQITNDIDLFRRQLPLRDQSLTNATKNR
jgi:tetratricopeptide (TPR) repeat protein